MSRHAPTRPVRDRCNDLVPARLRRVEAENERLRDLLATIGHDLRTPLNAVLGFTDLVLAGVCGELNEEQRRHLGTAYEAAGQLLRRIDELNRIARIEAGREGLRIEAVDVHAFLASVLDSLQQTAARRGVTLMLSGPGEPVVAHTDAEKIRQVISALVMRAIQRMPPGTIEVVWSQDDATLRICVHDSGPGMRQADLAQLFDRDSEGNGLHLCQRLAALLGGELTGESHGARGATFCLTLPVTI